MTLSKTVRAVTVGLLLAILVIGILPILLVYVLADINGLTEFHTSPFLLLISRFINGSNDSDDSTE